MTVGRSTSTVSTTRGRKSRARTLSWPMVMHPPRLCAKKAGSNSIHIHLQRCLGEASNASACELHIIHTTRIMHHLRLHNTVGVGQPEEISHSRSPHYSSECTYVDFHAQPPPCSVERTLKIMPIRIAPPPCLVSASQPASQPAIISTADGGREEHSSRGNASHTGGRGPLATAHLSGMTPSGNLQCQSLLSLCYSSSTGRKDAAR